MKTPLLIDREQAIEFLLRELYFSEFEIIDRLSQHPRGWNFYQWLYEHKLISKENYQQFQQEIEEQRKNDPDWD